MDVSEKRDNSTRLKKNMSKIAFRGKEKMLRSLGVGEETKDEIIDNYIHLVTKQQHQFHKFQRDMKAYLQSVTAMRNAANNFYSSLNDIYEDAWMGKDMLASLEKTTDLLYSDLLARLNTEVITALQEHLTHCDEMKVKTQKRGRKLVDFDAARRTFQTLQNSKKLEEGKLAKARDAMNQTRDTYETMNTQLHQELPDLHDSRVVLSTDVISNIASAEKAFFIELAEMRSKLLHVLSNVKDAYAGGEYKIQRLRSPVSRSDESTLPADEAIGTRSRGHSEARSENLPNTLDSRHSSQRPSTHSEDSEKAAQVSRRPNDYVNIEVGKPIYGNVTETPTVNGHGEPEDPVYTAVEFVEKTDERGPSKLAVTGVPKNEAEIPRPSPRLHTHQLEHPRDEEGGDPTNTAPSKQKDIPCPKPRTLLPSTSSQEKDDAESLTKNLDPTDEEFVTEQAPSSNLETDAAEKKKPDENLDEQHVYEAPPLPSSHKTQRPVSSPADAESHDNPPKPSDEILPPHFLYKAEALHPYQSTDDDELSFSKGDIIYVVEFPDPEEQDEGWQMGVLKSSWEDTGSTSGMAVFPENFTKRL